MAIFEKKRFANGRRRIYFFGIKIFSYKRKKDKKGVNSIDVLTYLEKYKGVLNNIPEAQVSTKPLNCIWQLWLQGLERRPDIVKKCMESVKKYAGGREVIVLTKDNLHEYIQLPHYIWEKYESGVITATHLSDIIRFVLLAQYGGTWIDATVLLTDYIPQDILDSEYFVFQDQFWLNYAQCPSLKLLQTLPSQISSSSWFIHATPNNILMRAILALLMVYWKQEDKLVDYFLLHKLFTLSLVYNKQCYDIFSKMPKYSQLPPHLLQRIQFNDFDENLYEEVLAWTSIHKMTYKYSMVPEKSFLQYVLKKNEY